MARRSVYLDIRILSFTEHFNCSGHHHGIRAEKFGILERQPPYILVVPFIPRLACSDLVRLNRVLWVLVSSKTFSVLLNRLSFLFFSKHPLSCGEQYIIRECHRHGYSQTQVTSEERLVSWLDFGESSIDLPVYFLAPLKCRVACHEPLPREDHLQSDPLGPDT